jgi:hypothetical protein
MCVGLFNVLRVCGVLKLVVIYSARLKLLVYMPPNLFGRGPLKIKTRGLHHVFVEVKVSHQWKRWDGSEMCVMGRAGNKGSCLTFLGAFAKLRLATVSFVMCVGPSLCLSVRMEQLGSHRTAFHEI